jgi:hypothetical protein
MSKEARLRYREAARSFLNADFTSALRAIDAALAALPSPLSLPSWIDQLSEEATGTSTAASDQRRKVVILFVTLVATCRATLDRDLPVSARQTPLLGPYIPLKPDAVVAKLFDGAVGRFAPSPPPPSEPSPLPSPEAAYLPPSVIVALALGALKLQAPRAAKAVCEAWLGSLDERAESTLEVEGDALDAAGTPTASLTASALSLSVTSTPNTESTGSPKRDALQSYERILELYALHILPAMGAWDEAEEWVKLLARETGGYARPGKVEVRLDARHMEADIDLTAHSGSASLSGKRSSIRPSPSSSNASAPSPRPSTTSSSSAPLPKRRPHPPPSLRSGRSEALRASVRRGRAAPRPRTSSPRRTRRRRSIETMLAFHRRL